MTATEKAMLETSDQLGLAGLEALPQGQDMLGKGMFSTDRTLFDTMRRNLPTENFLKIAVINAVETRLAEPKTLPDCVTKLRTYIQDIQIAMGILQVFGPAQQNVQINPIRVCAVIRAFAHHVRTVDSILATKIVLLGELSERMPMLNFAHWAVHLLGLGGRRPEHETDFPSYFRSYQRQTSGECRRRSRP
eukprot:5067010-Amphidinium_carterae.1